MSIVLKQNEAFANDEQLAKLIALKLPLIRRLASAAVCPGLDFDDAVQEGIIGLCSAVGSFSAEKGASFSTYSSACIQNAIASAVRAQSRKKHSPLNSAVELLQNAHSDGPEEIAIQNERRQEMLSNIESRLSLFEKRVLSKHLSGRTNTQISALLKTDIKAVENALSRARRKLR